MMIRMSVQSEDEWFVISERQPSRKCLKCLMVRYTASRSLLKDCTESQLGSSSWRRMKWDTRYHRYHWYILLKNSANSSVRGVHYETGWSIRLKVGEEASASLVALKVATAESVQVRD